MSEYTIRTLEPAELRAAGDLFRGALHAKDLTDEEAERAQRICQPGRTLGAFDPELIGTLRSFDAELTVPGGRRVPLAAVTSVGVRSDRTRRGVMTGLMRAQFAEFAERGVVAACLYASEGLIYSRFGYGIGTLAKTYTINTRRALLHDGVPAGGEITRLSLEVALEELPKLYDAMAHRHPGMMTRTSHWWAGFEQMCRRSEDAMITVVHHAEYGPDGFAVYSVRRRWPDPAVLSVEALEYTNPGAFAGLWRYLLGVDLVDEIRALFRPVDEPVDVLLTDPRQCTVTRYEDECWTRLADVEAALAARTYTGPPLVLEVVDAFLPANSGRYRIGEDGVARTDEPAALRLDVVALAMLYFGARQASALATAGRVEVLEPGAAEAADLLFSTRVAAWCGTFF
ncbi:GNAT family N-acetyltransferase [Amycolatopsis sp. NPDC059657]|uniref:GNAT family N-acetyltransferase n=1 Tax=Amycolatopsis sp. NPDC059657 TaxID=3346899 RepID=UPI00366AFEE8